MFKLFRATCGFPLDIYAVTVDCSSEEKKRAVEAFIIGRDDRTDFRGIRFVTSESLLEYEQENGQVVDFDCTAQEWAREQIWFMVYEEARKEGATARLHKPVELLPLDSNDLNSLWALGRFNRDLDRLMKGTKKEELRTKLRNLLRLTPPVATEIK